MRYFAIDPGLSGTGWAEFKDGKPTRCGVIYPKSQTSDLWEEKAEYIADQLLQDWFQVTELAYRSALRRIHVYIEMPQQMVSARGLAAQGGAVYKLAFLVGYLARAVHPCRVHAVTVNQWKGQLPKDVVNKRIIKTLGTDLCVKLNIRTHAWDAVGLGLWAGSHQHGD